MCQPEVKPLLDAISDLPLDDEGRREVPPGFLDPYRDMEEAAVGKMVVEALWDAVNCLENHVAGWKTMAESYEPSAATDSAIRAGHAALQASEGRI